MYRFYEFFAGGGMARAGLGPAWECLFANDWDDKKSQSYQRNWGAGVLKTADIRTLNAADLPGRADLAWASFPCQDLSLAGGGAGLQGRRSSAFWPFWALMLKLMETQRAPGLIVLENVCGTLTAHDGKDFSAICSAFQKAGYRLGALVIDAALFVPHSRPRLFMIGLNKALYTPPDMMGVGACAPWHTRSVCAAFDQLSALAKTNWIWWRLPLPLLTNKRFADLIEDAPTGVAWHSLEETNHLLNMMSVVNRQKVEQAKRTGRKMVGAIYKRTRVDENGYTAQRAEIRFDDIAGCLRTPVGGSSRQLILVVEGDQIKSRLISSRETARLMGLPDSYILPEKYNEAYHLTGDGVVVPVVRHLAEYIFEPLISANQRISEYWFSRVWREAA